MNECFDKYGIFSRRLSSSGVSPKLYISSITLNRGGTPPHIPFINAPMCSGARKVSTSIITGQSRPLLFN